MYIKQLNTLLWRNIILKKRAVIPTLLEILIPTLIILIIAKYSSVKNDYERIHGQKNAPIIDIGNFTEARFDDYLDFNFIFSSDFDDQKQKNFIENFKNLKYFSSNSYNFLESDKEFSFENKKNYEGYDDEEEEAYDEQKNIKKRAEENENLENNENENLENNENEDEEVYDNEFDYDDDYYDYKNRKNLYKSYVDKEFKITIFNKSKKMSNKCIENNYNKNEELDHFSFTSIYSCIGIVFSSLSKYTIHYDAGGDSEQLYENLVKDKYAYYYGGVYIGKEFIIQSLVDKALIKTLTNSPNSDDYTINTRNMDKLVYKQSVKKNSLESFIPFFMLFYFFPCVSSLLNNLVIEKETRIKESLVIIGLKRSTFWLSWAITYGVIIIISSTIVTIVMYICDFFSYISWTIAIITMVSYGLSCCCISFILSTIINKSKTASTVGIMLIIVFFALYFVDYALEKTIVPLKICSYTVSPVSFLALFNYLIKLEKQGLAVSFFTMLDNSTLRGYFFGIIFTLIMYFLIAVYLDNVLPQGNNFHRKWNFFITDYLCKKKNVEKPIVNESKKENPFIQQDPEGLQKAVEIKNISKSFNVKGETTKILKSIDFNAYYDEIFAILGHNGAGKTTLISIMTGILSATSGEIYYDNTPITGNETEVCRNFGYCPQFDTFNNSLTVAEHVKLFAGIKDVNVNVKEVLKDIDLLEKKNNYPNELSGGQRRKLCITLALLGSPKYVFLDEPTTGLDPYSRKNIWEVLSKKKKDRVIFITTHYMDEADLLADRKMIISSGEITCLGSSLFLKNSFNMNYSLDIHIQNSNDLALPDSSIEKICPEAIQTKKVGNTNIYVHQEAKQDSESSSSVTGDYIVTYLLPIKYSKDFKEIFESLNTLIKDENNSIKNFSLTAPTLEELFIKLESNDTNDLEKGIKKSTNVDMNQGNSELLSNLENIFGKTKINKRSSYQQILAIVILRLKLFLRNKTSAFLYTLIPLVIVLVCIYFENLVIKLYTEPTVFKPLDIKPSLYHDVQWFRNTQGSSGKALEIIKNINPKAKTSIKDIDYNTELTVDSGKLQFQKDLKYIGGFEGTENGQDLSFILYYNTTYTFSLPISINALSNAILKNNNINKQISVTYKPFDSYDDAEFIYNNYDEKNIINIFPQLLGGILEGILNLTIGIAISLTIAIYGPATVREREEGITYQLLLNGTSRLNYWLGVLISDTICMFIPFMFIAIAGLYNDISIFHIKVIVITIFFTLLWIVFSLMYEYIFCYFFKKYEKVTTLLTIINPILSLVIGFVALIVSLLNSYDIDTYGESDEDQIDDNKVANSFKFKSFALLILYAPAIIVLFYCSLSSFIILTKLKNNIEAYLTFITSEYTLKVLNDETLNEKEKESILTKKYFNSLVPNVFELLKMKSLSTLIIYALFLLLFYALILYLLEKIKTKIIKRNSVYSAERRKELDEKLESGPKDVYNEWKRVGQSINSNNSLSDNIALKVYQINKDFSISMAEWRRRIKKKNKKNKKGKKSSDEDNNNNKSAFQKMDDRVIFDNKKKLYISRIVEDVTFGVNTGECLGLLGPNGAGKTTSISMITGLLSHTHGTIKYGINDISLTDTADLSLGYCSQHDSLWKLLTVKETIQFYLNICGYPKKEIPRYTKALIEACGIEIHTNKKISEISGGTKRKVSLIVAICSSPSYLILDEPSAGMDPFTRRYMWKLISELKTVRETATILTTHSTEEAEALCDRIAILIKGRLVCIDTPRSIKMNHNNSYSLEVFTDKPSEFEDVYVKGENIFGIGPDENYEVETSINYQKYSVKMKIENIANVFALMENAKEKGIVSQYNFGQYSLEQVFISFINNCE